MKYKKYPKYKDSGIEWLGEIPEHWKIRKLKFIFAFHKKENQEENPTILSVTLTGIKIRDISTNEGQLAKSYLGYNVVNENNIVLNPMDLISGSVGKPPVKGVVSPAYTALKPLDFNIDIDFYVYFLKMHYTRKIFFPFGEGVSYKHRWTLKDETLKNFPILLPPLSEQKAIASFLDKQIEKIDTLIKKEEELIKLLKEKKEALITKAVTKGLNENVKMKDSGIEWLGEIPEHWEVRRLKSIIKSYVNGIWGDEPKGIKDTIVIRVADFDYEKLKIKDTNFTKRDIKEKDKEKRLLKYGDLLIERSGGGENQPVGRVVIFDKTFESVCSNFITKLAISEKFDNKFIMYIFSHLYNTKINVKSIKQTTGIQNLDLEQYLLEKIPLPPLQEQKQIAEYLDKKLSQIDKLIEKSKKAIELLKEKKESLITNAVTGKIDVRNINET